MRLRTSTAATGSTWRGRSRSTTSYPRAGTSSRPRPRRSRSATNSWQALANIPQAVTHMGVANDGRYIYVAGGYPPGVGTPQAFATTAVWRYDPSANTWSAMPSLPQARGGGALVLLDGILHYFGGSDASRLDRADHWTLA